MRKILMIAVLAMLQFSLVFSQTEKPITSGNIILGGSADIEFSKEKYNYYSDFPEENQRRSFLFILSPKLLYFVADHFAIGGQVTSGFVNTSYSYYRLGIGPSSSYYLDNGLMFGLDSKAYIDINRDFSENTITYEINPFVGYAWFINSKISIEPRINYSYYFNELLPDENTYIKRNSLFFNVSFSKFL